MYFHNEGKRKQFAGLKKKKKHQPVQMRAVDWKPVKKQLLKILLLQRNEPPKVQSC